MTRLAVPYFLTNRQPGLDLAVPVDITVETTLVDEAGWSPLLPLYEAVAGAVSRELAGGACPVVLSGDCTTALGTVAGIQRAGVDAGVIWLDAHGDVQTMETTTSGFLGGMPLRLLVGYRPELVADSLGVQPVAEDRVVLVDARDLDPPEVEYLDRSRIHRCPVADLSPQALPDGPLYVHVDLDIVDPVEIPHVRYPAPGGPGLDEVLAAVERVLSTGRVVCVGIACTWSPGDPVSDHLRTGLESMLSAWEAGH